MIFSFKIDCHNILNDHKEEIICNIYSKAKLYFKCTDLQRNIKRCKPVDPASKQKVETVDILPTMNKYRL